MWLNCLHTGLRLRFADDTVAGGVGICGEVLEGCAVVIIRESDCPAEIVLEQVRTSRIVSQKQVAGKQTMQDTERLRSNYPT